MGNRVVILTHPRLPLDPRFYLHDIAELWRSDGLQVTVARGPEGPADADVTIPHLPLTRHPPEFREALRRCPRSLNARVADISKRRISRLLLAPGDAYDGPVIVKSDRNNHGRGEAAVDPADRALVREYEVFESPAEIPAQTWEDPGLVVERFEPELEDGLFWLRTWEFLGDRETGSRYSSAHPVAQGSRLVWKEVLHGVPDELRRFRAELGLDFGSFDYGIAEGRVFLYDVNWTPGYSPSMPRDRARELVRTLADGLQGFL